MIKPSETNLTCPSCHSSLKKVLTEKAAYCPQCFTQFQDEIGKVITKKKDCYKDISPSLIKSALAEENYELAAKLTKKSTIDGELKNSIFTTLSIYRNLRDQKFYTHESMRDAEKTKINEIGLAATKGLNTPEKLIINCDSNHHLELKTFTEAPELLELKSLQEAVNLLDRNVQFAFSASFGFLGPERTHLGHAYSLKTAIALPHLFHEGQIPKLTKSCEILGIELRPLIKRKSQPLIYVLENSNSLELQPSEQIHHFAKITKTLTDAEIFTQHRQLEKGESQLFNQLSTSYWSGGAILNPSNYEVLSIMEDLYCAASFSYLSSEADDLKKLFVNTCQLLFNKNQLFGKEPSLDSPADTFEKLLRSLQA